MEPGFGPADTYDLEFCATGLPKDQEPAFRAGYLAGFAVGGQVYAEFVRRAFLDSE